MADDNEPLGSLPVEITGDFSELQDALNEAASAAQDGSDQIVSALQGVIDASGLAGGDLNVFKSVLEADQQAGIELAQSLQDLSESAASVGEVVAGAAASALEQLATAEQSAGQGASQATTEIEQLATATESASEAAEKGESAWGEFGETLLEFGGLALTAEGLKELATEALETYGNVEKATIALTALTGSASQATETIEGLKTLALTDALSFPSLVTAQQRMTAFGFSAEAIPGILQAAADAAAATGRNFDTVTNSIERMSLSGTAGARQLATLGITLTDLAGALGTTDDQAKEAFKDLDVSARVEAVSQALQKYQGVAQSVAQGVLGQFQNLQTKTEFVFESIGEAIAPAAEAFMSFASNVVLPEVQEIANGYKDLSIATTDLIGTLSSAGAEFANNAVNAAGLNAAVDQTNAIIKQTAEDSFSQGLIPALKLGAAAMQELNLGFEALVNYTPGAASMVQMMTQRLDDMASAAKMGGSAFSDAWAISVREATGSMSAFSSGAQYVVDNIAKLNQNIADGKEVLSELKTASDGSAASLQAIAAQSQSVTKAQNALASAMGISTKAVKDQKDSWDALVTTTDNQAQAYQNALDVWDAVSSAYNAGLTTLNGLAINLQTVTEAQNNLNKAFQAATGQTAQWVDSAASVASAVTSEANKFTQLQNTVAQTTAVLQALQNSFNNSVVVPGTNIVATLGMIQAAYAKVQAAVSALDKATAADGASMQELTGIQQNLNTVIVNGQAVVVGASTAVTGLAETTTDASGNISELTGFVNDGTQKIGDMSITSTAAANGLDSVTTAAGTSATAIVNNTKATTDNVNAKGMAAAADRAAAAAAIDLQNKLILENQAWANGQIAMVDFSGQLIKETTAATDAGSSATNLGTDLKQMASDMQSAGEVTNEQADAFLNLANAANTASDAVGKLKGGSGGAGGSGGEGAQLQGMEDLGSTALLSLQTLDPFLSQFTNPGSAAPGNPNESLSGYSPDNTLQAISNETNQAVQSIYGTFIPATQAAANYLQGLQQEANATGKTLLDTFGGVDTVVSPQLTAMAQVAQANAESTGGNTTATTANTAAVVASTPAFTVMNSTMAAAAAAGDDVVTSFAQLPSTIQDYLDSVNGTLVGYDDTTGQLEYTTAVLNSFGQATSQAMHTVGEAADELSSAETSTAASLATVAESSTGAADSMQQLVSSTAQAGSVIAQAATQVGTASSDVMGVVQKITGTLSNSIFGNSANAATGIGSADMFSPLGAYSNPNPGLMEGYAPNDGAGAGVTLNITVSGNFAASDSSIQMLANKVASAATTQLRTLGGLKN